MAMHHQFLCAPKKFGCLVRRAQQGVFAQPLPLNVLEHPIKDLVIKVSWLLGWFFR